MALIAPSLLAADFLKLQKECDLVNNSDADWFHLDVMDGRFVPNISFGPMIVEFVKKIAQKPCDVHLMIEEPGNYAEAFRNAGADHLTVHFEACPHLHRNVEQIRSLGMNAGVALNPHTPVALLADILHDLDIVLIMSVNPGFGGQQFITHSIQKIRELKKMIRERNLRTQIVVDGGVTLLNAAAILEVGADVLVAGSSIFNANDPAKAISKLRQANVKL
jgi:ribulose-phosphate 3-epimerase